ncbi:MAG: EF-P beta-lysylation protein EpmB, partial [Planctomycetota bacterium]
LVTRLGLPDSLRAPARDAARAFGLVAPEAFVARMRHGDPNDPLLAQVLPVGAELAPAPPNFVADPCGDAEALRAPGLLQKYRGRALLIVTGVCAVACRYCFRREFPYADGPSGLAQWRPALDVLRDSHDVEEVLLSGGDPLMRPDDWLAQLVGQLESIPHLRRLRLHTRLPVVIPDRVDDALLTWLGETRLAPTVVVHSNHPDEIDEDCASALRRLVQRGVPVLNQTVLLRGVNDDADTLTELSRRLLDARVMPYYLHQLDPVRGAQHWEVPVERGHELIAALRGRLPGFGVPRYVREVVGAAHKVELGPGA